MIRTISVNGQPLEMSRSEFFGHIRQNFVVGEKITLDILRNGKPVSVAMTLK